MGAQTGRTPLITFDTGGTSAEIGITNDGRIVETDARSTSIARFPLQMPMLGIQPSGKVEVLSRIWTPAARFASAPNQRAHNRGLRPVGGEGPCP